MSMNKFFGRLHVLAYRAVRQCRVQEEHAQVFVVDADTERAEARCMKCDAAASVHVASADLEFPCGGCGAPLILRVV